MERGSEQHEQRLTEAGAAGVGRPSPAVQPPASGIGHSAVHTAKSTGLCGEENELRPGRRGPVRAGRGAGQGPRSLFLA